MLAKRYQAAKIRIFFIELIMALAYFLIFQFSGLSHLTKIYILKFLKNQALLTAGYVFVFGCIYYLLTLPIKFYTEFLLEHRYSRSNQTFLNWLKDEIKATAISAAVLLVFIELFYLLLRKSQFYWWFWMAVIWFLFSVFFARIFPVLILPLFYRYKDVKRPGLKQALLDLAKKSGIDAPGIFEIDFSKKTKKANAALVGLGKSKRIILADNLLSDYTEGEIKVVVAHELGHRKYRHMWKLMLFGAITTLGGFYTIFIFTGRIVKLLGISGIYDIEAFPILSLVLALFSFMTLPLHNFYSRRLEREADAFSLAETQDKESFISCMKKLAEQNLSDPSPNRLIEILLYDHPPMSKRIKFAEGYLA